MTTKHNGKHVFFYITPQNFRFVYVVQVIQIIQFFFSNMLVPPGQHRRPATKGLIGARCTTDNMNDYLLTINLNMDILHLNVLSLQRNVTLWLFKEYFCKFCFSLVTLIQTLCFHVKTETIFWHEYSAKLDFL